jgi:hypothetical protein
MIKRNRTRLTGTVLTALLVFAAAACDYDMNAETLTVVVAQEDGFFSDGDEPYLLVIEWRSIPGEAGSTATQFKSANLNELSTGAFDGEVLTIPPASGSSDINNIQFVDNIADVIAGTAPELIGTVMIAMESDATPWFLVENIALDVQAALQTELANIIEPLTLADLVNPAQLTERLNNAALNVQNEVTPTIAEAIGIWFASLGDPDDLIDIGFEVWVAADGDLGNAIDPILQAALPANAEGGKLYHNEVRTHRFAGDDAVYDVTTRLILEDV